MNVTTTMQLLYVIKAHFDFLAKQLNDQGHKMAAAELLRESDKFGCQLTQIDSVLDDYQIDIASVLLPPTPDGSAAKFYGVDMGAPDSERTFCNGVMYR